MIYKNVILIFNILIVINAVWDWFEISRGIYPNHFLESCINVVLVFLCVVICIGFNKIALMYGLVYFPVRWLLFDFLLNIFRREPLNYIGQLEPTSSLLDRFLHRVGINWQYPVKAAALGIVIFCNILIYQYI